MWKLTLGYGICYLSLMPLIQAHLLLMYSKVKTYLGSITNDFQGSYLRTDPYA